MNNYKEELAKFMKANKQRREKVAEKNGFKTANKYKAFLKGKIGGIEESSELDSQPLDMVVAFDTTGSMSSYISAVRKHVKELIPKIFKNSPNVQMKIVAFGDYCDMIDKDTFGKAYQESSLTNDAEELIDFVNFSHDTGGGDSDEFYELVIKKIVEETPWREDAKKSILLIGDAEPHEIGYFYDGHYDEIIIKDNQIDWKQECKKAAEKGIQIDTLRIHDYITFYEEVSRITNGVCLNFSNSEKTSNIVEGLAYARSSTTAYYSTMDTVTASGDEELIGAYKQMGTLL